MAAIEDYKASQKHERDTERHTDQSAQSWVTAEITKILGYDDDVVVGMAFEMLESQKNVSE